MGAKSRRISMRIGLVLDLGNQPPNFDLYSDSDGSRPWVPTIIDEPYQGLKHQDL